MKLLVSPESSSYNLSFPQSAIRTELQGGRGRYRADVLGGSVKLSGVQWRLSPEDFDYMMAFYRQQTKEAAEPFEMDLFVKEAGLTECVCNIIPGTFGLNQQSGLTYVVGADLEVSMPFDPDEVTDDNAIIAAYNADHDYTP